MWQFAAQAGAGLIQSIIGGVNARKQQKRLDQHISQTPTYEPNKSVLDFYNTALQRYGVSPTDSAMYKQQMKDVNQNVATTVAGLQDRRSALAGIPSILRAANDAKLNANVAAEQQKNQRFNELGQATGMKASEEQLAFKQNKMLPFELKYNILSQKAGAANQTLNAGLTNIFGGLQNWGNYNTAKQDGLIQQNKTGNGYTK